jgi:hypothetical protein
VGRRRCQIGWAYTVLIQAGSKCPCQDGPMDLSDYFTASYRRSWTVRVSRSIAAWSGVP